MNNGYGHKVAMRDTSGCPIGSLVVHAGKHGPRLAKNELRAPDPASIALVDEAWAAITGADQVMRPSAKQSLLPGDCDAVAEYAGILVDLAHRAVAYADRPGLDWSDLQIALTDLAVQLGQRQATALESNITTKPSELVKVANALLSGL